MKLPLFRTGACALALTLTLAAPALAAGGFSDVADGAWYAGAVSEVSAKGLMTGVSDTLFAPDASVTRATVATTLWRMEGEPVPMAGGAFSDVPEDTWYTQAVDWAAGVGVASGDGKGAFSPDTPVTREQLAVFLFNYCRYKGMETAEGVLDQFSDAASIHAWAKEGMAHAVGAGLFEGGDGNRLSPLGTASRAQLAVLIQRLTTPAMG